MAISNFVIKTAESELKEDRNTRNYKTVTFTECVMMQTPWGLVPKPSTQCVSTKINCYEENYLGKEDPGYNDPIFDAKNPSDGGIFMGAIPQRMVEEYEIVSSDGTVREVETYKTVVFGDTSSPSWEKVVKAAFKSRGHEIIEEEDTDNVSSVTRIVHTDSKTVDA
jgi:hypothetical protein